MNRSRILFASVIVLAMVALQWIVPIIWSQAPASAAEAVAFGMPAQLSFYLWYGAAAMLALWVVFRLVWPSSDR